MLQVKTPQEAFDIIEQTFSRTLPTERITADNALGRIIAEDVRAEEYVPGFDRSTVDGYAVIAADTFGCSDSIPAILEKAGAVEMGESPAFAVTQGKCVEIPTGGAVPKGADAAVMVEYTEDYGDGTVGIAKSIAPGGNIIFKGDDVFPGKTVLHRGRKLSAQDIGALAAMGKCLVTVIRKPKIAIISTGNELVEPDKIPKDGQIRDVNTSLLRALLTAWGAEAVPCGIVEDDEEKLFAAAEGALSRCDGIIISGGSSVGEKDNACRVIARLGEVLLHGIAMKPGKPTIIGRAGDKPMFGLPGHPVAACFTARLFVRKTLAQLTGEKYELRPISAEISENIGSNHGREEYIPVKLKSENGRTTAYPIRTKSGLITSLAGDDGWMRIPRDCEGIEKGQTVDIILNCVG